MKIKFWNIVESIESFIQNAATDVRTWTFPDKDGTVMMTNDVIDEDNFSTDSATRPPSQQSVRVYADAIIGVGTTSGTNSYTVNVGSPKTILTSGYLYAIKWAAASTGAVTLDIQSAGAKKVFKDPTTQAGNGDLVQNSVSLMMYQSTLDGGTGGYLIIGGVGGGGSSTFVGLTDGPGSFSGHGLDYTRVNSGATALEYITPAQVASDISAATLTGTQTLTNKRITPRVQSVTSSATVTPDADANDAVKITAQAAGLTLANPSGTPTDMQTMEVRIKDNGTSRSISYGTQYRAIGVILPSATTISKTIYLGMVWNSDDTKWDVVGVSIEQ